MGAVRGDDARLEWSLLDVVEAVSEMVSLLDAGLFLLSLSSTCGSMASRLMFSQPFWILTLASARRSWRALVIFGGVSMSHTAETAQIHVMWLMPYLGHLGPPQHLGSNLILLQLVRSRHAEERRGQTSAQKQSTAEQRLMTKWRVWIRESVEISIRSEKASRRRMQAARAAVVLHGSDCTFHSSRSAMGEGAPHRFRPSANESTLAKA